MNALWLNRLYAYKSTPLALESAKQIMKVKIARETLLVRSYQKYGMQAHVDNAKTMQELLLIEARSARQFWRMFAIAIPQSYRFTGRKPHASDIPNKLLDIGFHHIATAVQQILEADAIPVEVGLFHTAHTMDSAPLVYDLVELFRADLVGTELLRFLRLKKKSLIELTHKDIAQFLANINKRMERRYYLKEFRQCHTYRYYMELQILRFIKAINHREIFDPFILPTRHDTRCA